MKEEKSTVWIACAPGTSVSGECILRRWAWEVTGHDLRPLLGDQQMEFVAEAFVAGMAVVIHERPGVGVEFYCDATVKIPEKVVTNE